MLLTCVTRNTAQDAVCLYIFLKIISRDNVCLVVVRLLLISAACFGSENIKLK